MLMLGTGESGKSTVVKQLRILHNQGYSLEERQKFTPHIYHNILQSAQQLTAGVDQLNISWSDAELDLLEQCTLSESRKYQLSFEELVVLRQLWNQNSALSSAWERRSEFQVNDSAAYFLDHLGDIMSPGYVPSFQDILRARAKSLGLNE